jgi:hypothetical protein
LRRLILALFLVFRLQCPAGIRTLQRFIRAAQLDPFVASSYGALYDLDCRLAEDLTLFGSEERQRLAAGLTTDPDDRKPIPLCADEHFHADTPCLIGIEPVSNFILVEAYYPHRDGQTWANAIIAGTQGLPVQVVVVTSDQASGLIKCAKELQAQFWPELFHLQRDLAQAILPALSRPISSAEKELQQAQQKSESLDQREQRRPDSVEASQMEAAAQKELASEQQLEQLRQRAEGAREQLQAISTAFHPFDGKTGKPVTTEMLQERLNKPVEQLEQVVEQAKLPERSRQGVQKAREWVVTLVGCLAWFWTLVESRLEKLDLSEEGEKRVKEYLLGACYWEQVSERTADKDEKERLKKLAKHLRREAWAEGELAGLSEEEKAKVERVCRECVGLFSRSSSCVEGRNGRLSLFQHGQTRISDKRLKALTVVHNYLIRRSDGSTAAERFFGQQQRDLFDWLLERMPDLPKPAAKRPKKNGESPAKAA